MSRQKVSDDKRQRTARACDYCKRRKQKCNGEEPCTPCAMKKLTCTYSPGHSSRTTPSSPTSPPARRRRTRSSAASASASRQRAVTSRSLARTKNRPSLELGSALFQGGPARHHHHHHYMSPPSVAYSDHALKDATRTSTESGRDEEAVLEHAPRLLQDRTGRRLYIGDSATLSLLHQIRRLAESIRGPCDFTTDPSQGIIVEARADLPPQVRPPSMMPDRDTANVLVRFFFTNTSGLVEIFDRDDFISSMDACYDSPLSASNQFLCLLFLTFAIGLVMATPKPGTAESAIVQHLVSQPFDQAELFVQSAKSLCDPVGGLVDADFWSVQALTLLSIYMLAVSRRNAAFSYHGMAVRSAMALGLHHNEVMASATGPQQTARRNVWASLYVLDRFLAASLGRPMAIHEDELDEAGYGSPACAATETHELGVNANVRSSRIMGNILQKVYARRRVATAATQDIVQQCGIWTKNLDASLRWHSKPSTPPAEHPGLLERPGAESIAVLHVNLFYCHSMILLTRPFFLFLARSSRQDTRCASPSLRSRTEKFAEVCVTASYHTITMIQDALDAGVLSRRNPFVIYFLFTAALLIMTNELAALFLHPAYDKHAAQAISIMAYCSKADAQAARMLWILQELQKTVAAQAAHDVIASGTSDAAVPDSASRPFHFCFPEYLTKEAYDPIALFFARDTATRSCWSTSGAVTDNRQVTGSQLAASFLQTPPQTSTVDPAYYYQTPFTDHSSVSTYSDHAGDYFGIPSTEPACTPLQPTLFHPNSTPVLYSPSHNAEAIVYHVGSMLETKPGANSSESVGPAIDELDLSHSWSWPSNTALAGADAGFTTEHESYPTPAGDVVPSPQQIGPRPSPLLVSYAPYMASGSMAVPMIL